MKTFALLVALAAAVLPARAAEFAPVSATAASTASVAVGTTRVANWKDDKTGAFVLMFDDGWPSHWQVAMPELVKRGMTATFYIVPNKGEFKKFESTWKEKMVPAGMVLGNHTMTHDGFQGAQDTEWEYTECTKYLLGFVPGKIPRLISFALPGVKDYDYGGTDIAALMAKNNLIDRGDFKGHGATYHLKTTAEMLAMADKAIAEKSMEYIVFHGVERITPDWGYQDMWSPKTEVFQGFLDGLQTRRERGDLWITDHIMAYKYQQERSTARVRTTGATAKEITLELTSATDAQLYDEPLTLVTHVPLQWPQCTVTQGAKTTTVAPTNGNLQFEALPNAAPISLRPVTP